MRDSLAMLGGTWAMEPRALETLAAQFAGLDVHAAAGAGPGAAARPYQVDGDGVAVLHIRGAMLPSVSPLIRYYAPILGIAFTDMGELRGQLAAAVEDGTVRSIRLEIDSPGGTVDGTKALADDVAAAAGLKTVEAQVEGCMASAALWVASQASRVRVGPTTAVGSIGTFAVIEDSSGAAEQAGLRVHVISNAPGKGGAPGAPVRPERIANTRALVDGLTAQFVADLARGRRMSSDEVAALATGELWLGADAVRRGLADAVGPDRHAIGRGSGRRALAADLPQATLEAIAAARALAVPSAGGIPTITLLADLPPSTVEHIRESFLRAMEPSSIPPLRERLAARFASLQPSPAPEAMELQMSSARILELDEQSRASAAEAARLRSLAASGAAAAGMAPTAGERKVAKIFGVTVESMRFHSNVLGRYADGSIALIDYADESGQRVVSGEEFDTMKAAAMKVAGL